MIWKETTLNPQSKVDADGHDPDRCAFVGIKHIAGQIDLLVRETEQETPLDLAVRFVGACAVSDQAESEPLHRRDGQFRPIVKEARRRIRRIDEIFAFTVKLELPPTQRPFVPGGETSAVSENA